MWKLASWLATFDDDDEFRKQLFGGKKLGKGLNDDDIQRMKAIKRDKQVLSGIGEANFYFILKNLGGDFLKPDRWVNEFLMWYGGLKVGELARRLRESNLHCGQFDSYLWSYCEREIDSINDLHVHFDSLFSNNDGMPTERIKDFEDDVWSRERIRIVVRDRENRQACWKYDYLKAAPKDWTVTEFLDKRVQLYMDEREAVVIKGDGSKAHGATKLSSVRDSYS